MSKIDVLNIKGEAVSEAELKDEIFAVEVSDHAVYEAVKNHLANKRQGTQSAKTRAEVRGGGRKPWRQKGTGRARAGSIRSPLWTGGGIIFAPKPREYSYKIPKKTKRLALKSALTNKAEESKLIILDEMNFDEISTKKANEALKAITDERKILIALGEKDETVYKSFRNIPGVKVMVANHLNVYDIINAGALVMTKDALALIEEVFN